MRLQSVKTAETKRLNVMSNKTRKNVFPDTAEARTRAKQLGTAQKDANPNAVRARRLGLFLAFKQAEKPRPSPRTPRARRSWRGCAERRAKRKPRGAMASQAGCCMRLGPAAHGDGRTLWRQRSHHCADQETNAREERGAAYTFHVAGPELPKRAQRKAAQPRTAKSEHRKQKALKRPRAS